MTVRHVLVSLAVTCLCACSSDDTIVSLNVTASDRVPVVARMQVTVKQGSRTFEYDFAPPTEEPEDGTPSVKNGFFERITLPGDWSESVAEISVEAFQKGGGAFEPALTDETTVTLRPEGAVAAYVKLDMPEEPPMGGAGGEGGAGGTASEGGVPSEGGAVTNGGAPAEAGAGPGGVSGVGGASAGAGGAD
jgi:hypothetical protein